MVQVKPEQYFVENDLSESLVIGMLHFPRENALELIVDFARTPDLLRYLETGVKSPESPPRDFRRLSFSGVSDVRVSDVVMRVALDLLHYSTKDNRPLVLQHAEIQCSGRPTIRLQFGTHGTVMFSFGSLSVDRRKGRAVKVDGDYVYYDVDSGEKLDFNNPFQLNNIWV